ncbi:MAG: Uma2 family endonuclease, partial [bacterium]
DLMVRRLHPAGSFDWDEALTPSLVVEVISDSTRRRDLGPKRELYLDAGVPEYWVVDPKVKNIRVVRPGEADQLATERLTWSSVGARESLVIEVASIFG